MTKRILIGKVTTAHGIKGDVKVLCYADDPALLFGDDGVYTDETTPKRVVLLPRAEPRANLFIVSIEGVSDRNAAERLRNLSFYIDREELPETEEGAVYHSDLEGMDVVSVEGKVMGKVLRMQNFGAGDLIEVQGRKESYYIPFAEPYLISVDRDARRIVVTEPEVM